MGFFFFENVLLIDIFKLYFKLFLKNMQMENNIDLKQYNTLQIPVKTKYFVRIQNEADIYELMDTDLRKFEKHCILN